MRYGLFDNFTRSFIILLFIICHDFSKAIISAYAASLNNSDEIKNIFRHADVTNNTIRPDLKGTHKNETFVEGGAVDVLSSTYVSTKDLGHKTLSGTGNVSVTGTLERQNITFQKNVSDGKSKNLMNSSSYKTLQDPTLPGTGSNLFLGVPEVIHINGTSSIKPRKGVNFNTDNKIVPHKGVDNENKESYSFISNYSCFWLSKNDCYNAEGMQNLECSCCKEGNALGEIFKQQTLVNCSQCKQPMLLSAEEKLTCKSICCKSFFHDINSISTTQDNSVKLKNNSKLKPTVTKVPYDVEVVPELLSKAKQKVFLPVVVSLLLLPLIGISIFCIWRRTKEYWDKRFYKRMDFLIDGMYND